MHSPPSSKTDFKDLYKYRAARATSIHPARPPQLLHRSSEGRISRPRSNPSLSLSIRNQQALWETVTGRNWASERLDPNPKPVQSLQYIAPQSLTVSPSHSAASSSARVNFEPISTVIAPADTAAEPVENRELLSSMEFVIPQGYNHFGSYPSSYQSSYMDHYPNHEDEDEDYKPRISPQVTSYPPSYTSAASTSLAQGSPALSPRGGSAETDTRGTYSYPSASHPPYETTTTAPPNYTYTQAPPATMSGAAYHSPYTTSHDPYNPQYGSVYPHNTSSFLHPQPSGYASNGYASPSGYSIVPAGARAIDAHRLDANNSPSRVKPTCWDHGCNGKQFSTASNLMRHQRERTGQASKSECSRCGASFTRKTAKDGHEKHNKCRRRNEHDSQ